MKRANCGKPCFSLLTGLVSLGLCGCVERSEPLTDAATSAIDAKLVGEWKATVNFDRGGVGDVYLVIRPFKQDGAPPGLMQAEQLTYTRGGNPLIANSERMYFTVGTVGDSQYASICSGAEIAGTDGYRRWLETKGHTWYIVGYQVVGDKLFFRQLILGYPGTYVRADAPPPPRPTAFLGEMTPLNPGPAIPIGLCVAGLLVLVLLAVAESFLSSPWKPRTPDSRSGAQQGAPSSSGPSWWYVLRGAVMGAIIGAIAVGLLCLLLLLGELFALAWGALAWGGIDSFDEIVRGLNYPPHLHDGAVVRLGAGLGFIAFFPWVALARRRKKTATAPPPGWIKRIMRGVLVGAAALILAAGASMAATRARVAAAGWLHGERCFRGLPASYWMGELRSGAEGLRHNPFGSLITVFSFEDNLGAVTVLSRHIGKDAVPGLVSMLHDQDPAVRRLAVITLARIGPAAADAAPALLEQLDKEDEHDRRKDIVDAIELIDPNTATKIGQ